MDDSVQIRCTKCKSRFRDRARRVQSGYSRQCPHCDVVMFFEEGSTDSNIRDALGQAQKVRAALLQEEADKAGSRGPALRR